MLKRVILPAVLVLGLCAPSFAVSKEILQLQQQVSLLMQQIRDLQRDFDTNIAVVKSLVSQNTDSVNKLSVAVNTIQQTLNSQTATSGQQQQQIAQQFQSLSDSIDEIRTRLNNMNELLNQVRQNQTTLPAPTPAQGAQVQPGQPGQPGGAAPSPSASLPPDQLYQSALSDYIAGNYDLAKDEFNSFINAYPTDDHAADSMYYLGDILARQHKYNNAVDQFNQLIEKFPDAKLVPSAQLKKAYALEALGKKDAAVRELRNLVSHYPHSQEAGQARSELRVLGVAVRG
jgi:tol-pal system protein YbgF